MTLMDAALFGMIVADVIAQPMDGRELPLPGGMRHVNSIQFATGGSVCNTGIAMARLGMNVAACGLIGEDVLGKALVEHIRAAGINTDAIFTSTDAQTSTTVVVVDSDGERSFIHATGVARLVDSKLFRRCIPTFRHCAWLHIGYFGLLPGLTEDLPDLLRECRQISPGTKIALDTVNPPEPMERLIPILPLVDVFAPSRPEAQELTGEKQAHRMVAAFRRHMPQGIIGIKLDSDGCLLDDVQQSVLAPGYKIDVIDTTGAGDTWFAGLLVGLRRNMPLEQAAKFANRAAADCCTALGASTGVRSFEETMSRI